MILPIKIVVRGNSPRSLLWRIEGIEVLSPNHFGNVGDGGGGISMLSSSTLSNSDFYTGAFPSEYGNAIGGVFDLRLRNGNKDKREYSIMIGALGIEAAMEGPFKKDGKGSYLINYRYSTLGLLGKVGLNPVGDVLPEYQDFSFKLNFPTEKVGTFSLFGVGGLNTASQVAEPDSTLWDDDEDSETFNDFERKYILGLSHTYLLNNNSYVKTVISAQGARKTEDDRFLDAAQNYREITEEQEESNDNAYRISTQYNKKFSARNTVRIGAIYSALKL